ncbi:hypothetical protein HCB45_14200 [Listeria sp. FSL L7-0091]|uniref:hypothetical protein n=1 Tax=Listeria farberi TaxID=2713500 RepID=UPI00162448F5|nr:hypothetical protein [Listeria farberi]MBC2262710.1 hypothetical protein [Listeria farberi]
MNNYETRLKIRNKQVIRKTTKQLISASLGKIALVLDEYIALTFYETEQNNNNH